MQKQVTDIVMVDNPITTTLNNQNSLWKKLKGISASISKAQNELKVKLDEIKYAPANIDIKRHWYGSVNIDSICNSLTYVYDNLRTYIQTLGNAMRTSNENLSHTLELIKLLAMIEKDLYERLDDESIQGNALKQLIRDWCQKNNIQDQEVKQLLEVSFQRAYTLRDRINHLRGEIMNKFGEHDSELSKLSSSIDGLKSFVSTEKVKALHELSDLFKSKEDSLNKLSMEKNNEVSRLYKDKLLRIETISKSIENKYNEYLCYIKSKQYEINNQIKEAKESLTQNLKYLNTKEEQVILAIESLSAKKKTEISEQADKINTQYKELCKSTTEAQQEYKKNIEKDQQNYFSEVQSSLNTLHERLNLSLLSIDKKSDERKAEIFKLKEQIEFDNHTAQSQIKKQIDLFEETYKIQLETQKKEYESLLKTQQTNLYEALEKAHSIAKRWAIGGTIAGIGLALTVSFTISMLL